MPATSFWEHPLDKLEEALNIRKQIAALETKLKSMFGGEGDEPAKAPASSKRTGKRSAAVRAKMAAAQKARWAKKGEAITPVAAAIPQAAPKPAKKKGGMSAAGRAAIVAAQKARWAKVKVAKAPTAAVISKIAKIEAKAPKTKKVKRSFSPEARAKMAEAAKRRWAKQKTV